MRRGRARRSEARCGGAAGSSLRALQGVAACACFVGFVRPAGGRSVRAARLWAGGTPGGAARPNTRRRSGAGHPAAQRGRTPDGAAGRNTRRRSGCAGHATRPARAAAGGRAAALDTTASAGRRQARDEAGHAVADALAGDSAAIGSRARAATWQARRHGRALGARRTSGSVRDQDVIWSKRRQGRHLAVHGWREVAQPHGKIKPLRLLRTLPGHCPQDRLIHPMG